MIHSDKLKILCNFTGGVHTNCIAYHIGCVYVRGRNAENWFIVFLAFACELCEPQTHGLFSRFILFNRKKRRKNVSESIGLARARLRFFCGKYFRFSPVQCDEFSIFALSSIFCQSLQRRHFAEFMTNLRCVSFTFHGAVSSTTTSNTHSHTTTERVCIVHVEPVVQ